MDLNSERSISRNTELSQQSLSTSESLTTVKSNHEKPVSVCKQCRDTCLRADAYAEDDYDDTWGSLMMCGMSGIDPFAPNALPSISVMPPTPDKQGPSRFQSMLNERPCLSAPCSPVPTIVVIFFSIRIWLCLFLDSRDLKVEFLK